MKPHQKGEDDKLIRGLGGVGGYQEARCCSSACHELLCPPSCCHCDQGPPHTHSVLPYVLTALLITAQLDREFVGKISRFVQLKFPDCVTLGTAEDLTAQFTSDCSVCCFLKAEAQFVHSFNLLALELDIYSLAHHLCKM